MSILRFPADWMLSWVQTFVTQQFRNFTTEYLKVARTETCRNKACAGKPMWIAAKDGNSQTEKFGGTIPNTSFNLWSNRDADPYTQVPFRGGNNALLGFKTVLKVLNRYTLITTLDLSKYHAVLLKDMVGWGEHEKNTLHFHKASKEDKQKFYDRTFGGCKPEKSDVPKWKDRYPMKGCVPAAAWDWWNEAAYLDYILFFWARRRTFDELCRRGIEVPEAEMRTLESRHVAAAGGAGTGGAGRGGGTLMRPPGPAHGP